MSPEPPAQQQQPSKKRRKSERKETEPKPAADTCSAEGVKGEEELIHTMIGGEEPGEEPVCTMIGGEEEAGVVTSMGDQATFQLNAELDDTGDTAPLVPAKKKRSGQKRKYGSRVEITLPNYQKLITLLVQN